MRSKHSQTWRRLFHRLRKMVSLGYSATGAGKAGEYGYAAGTIQPDNSYRDHARFTGFCD